jgi:hypothetical protein
MKCAAIIEYEYPGKGSPVEEVRKCLEYARNALAWISTTPIDLRF